MTGRFIAVVGPSGVGKDSVMSALAASEPRLSLVRRVITRDADAGGEDYEAVSEEIFRRRVADGQFALHWQAHGLHYGIPISVGDRLARGEDVLANLSRTALRAMADRFDRWDILALTAEPDVLRARLLSRGRETPADIDRRLARAGNTIPSGLEAKELDNSGALEETVRTALGLLYPASAKRLIS